MTTQTIAFTDIFPQDLLDLIYAQGNQNVLANQRSSLAGLAESAAARGVVHVDPSAVMDTVLDAERNAALGAGVLGVYSSMLDALINLINGREQRAHEIVLENLRRDNELIIIAARRDAEIAVLQERADLNAADIAWYKTQFETIYTNLRGDIDTIKAATVTIPGTDEDAYDAAISAWASLQGAIARAMTTYSMPSIPRSVS